MASGVRVMEKPILLQQQQQQQQSHETLKCPRCDSSNTKFCYYNNYSLAQPRHFCKSCKRYWTRGGTLRNVPVGGGCRKNKRVKKPITTTTVHVAATPASVNRKTNPNPNANLDHNSISSSITANDESNHHLNPLFYGILPQYPNYPRFDTRVNSNLNSIAGYDLVQPNMNASGLGFTSTGETGSLVANHCHNSGLSFSSYMNSSMYCVGSSSSSTSAPTMASLLASGLNQPQRFMGFAAYDGGSVLKDLKTEDTHNRIMEWNTNNFDDQNNNVQTEAVVSSDQNSLLWDTEGGNWLDPSNNTGSSVPSMI